MMPSLPQKCQHLFSMYAKIDPSILKSRVSLVSPSNLYVYFQKILEKRQFHIENPEKNYNTMTYPPFVLFDNSNAQHQKSSCYDNILSTNDVQYCQSVSNHHILQVWEEI